MRAHRNLNNGFASQLKQPPLTRVRFQPLSLPLSLSLCSVALFYARFPGNFHPFHSILNTISFSQEWHGYQVNWSVYGLLKGSDLAGSILIRRARLQKNIRSPLLVPFGFHPFSNFPRISLLAGGAIKAAGTCSPCFQFIRQPRVDRRGKKLKMTRREETLERSRKFPFGAGTKQVQSREVGQKRVNAGAEKKWEEMHVAGENTCIDIWNASATSSKHISSIRVRWFSHTARVSWHKSETSFLIDRVSPSYVYVSMAVTWKDPGIEKIE